LPLTLDRKNKKGAGTPGLWNSLSRTLGPQSFDEANGATRWKCWLSSGSPLAAEAFGLIARIKLSFSDACLSLGKDPGTNSVLAVPDEGFGFNINKLHRTSNEKLKDLQLERLTERIQGELHKDDLRRKVLELSDSFSNSFPIFIDPSVLFDSHEFITAMQRKLGCAVTFVAPFVGHPIATN
jgi:hypothetical protein